MGSVMEFPPAVVPGRLKVEGELTPSDLRIVIDKLKAASEKLRNRTAAAALPPAGPAQPSAGPVAHPPPRPAPPPSAAFAAPAPAPARPPPPYAALAPAQRPAAAPAAAATPSWQHRWTSDSSDHGGDAVTAAAFLPSVPGLPGGDGHAGWLVSSSRGLLNLWECSPGGGRGEAALMMMHSQATDYTSLALEAEPGTKLLLAASADGGGAEWVSSHSLEVESLLASKCRWPMPHQPAARQPGRNHTAVVSLHPFGGPLAEHCAASYGGGIVVWPTGSLAKPRPPGNPRAVWKAHAGLITTLHRSAHGLHLWSGAADGTVHMWNMREKPERPASVFRHTGPVSGVHQTSEHSLVTAAADGQLFLWDIRRGAAPLGVAIPDGQPIVRLAVAPFGDSVALATTQGLYSVDVLDTGSDILAAPPITSAPLRSAVTALAFNATTQDVIVGGGPGPQGTLSVFRQSLPYR